MTRVFAYLRLSGEGQVDGDGFARQLNADKQCAPEHDIKILKVFRDEGVSGTKDRADRPALSAMLTALHSNGTGLVLLENLDRLARDLVVQETIIGDLRKHGFDLMSVAEPDLLQDKPTRELMREAFGAISENEKTMFLLELRGAQAGEGPQWPV